MAWVDLDYYKNEYLMGREPRISDRDFPFWGSQAETKINLWKVTVDEPQDCLKKCVCEVAELLYADSKKKNKNLVADINTIKSNHLFNTDYFNDFISAVLR